MALFSFTDLRFKTATRSGFGAVGNLVGDRRYDTNILKYPADLGSSDKGHYMVIHVNTQVKTQFQSNLSGDLPTILQNGGIPPIYSSIGKVGEGAVDLVGITDKISGGALTNIATKAGSLIEKLDRFGIRNGLGQIGSNVTGNRSASEILSSGARTIQRTTETIALYMPDTLNFTYNQQYDSTSLTGDLAAAISAGASVVDALKTSGATTEGAVGVGSNLTPFIMNAVAQRSGSNLLRAGFAAITGTVQNPMLEMLYSSPSFRSFRFDFMFYPRDEKEAEEVQKILNTLRFHQAPEVATEGSGFFLVPPSEFDIKFYYNGKENVNIPQISTCVLESIDVDYAPNGFSAYEVPGQNTPSLGKTGMPVAIRLSLQFKETEILTKTNFANGRKKTSRVVGTDFSGTVTSADEIDSSYGYRDGGH